MQNGAVVYMLKPLKFDIENPIMSLYHANMQDHPLSQLPVQNIIKDIFRLFEFLFAHLWFQNSSICQPRHCPRSES